MPCLEPTRGLLIALGAKLKSRPWLTRSCVLWPFLIPSDSLSGFLSPRRSSDSLEDLVCPGSLFFYKLFSSAWNITQASQNQTHHLYLSSKTLSSRKPSLTFITSCLGPFWALLLQLVPPSIYHSCKYPFLYVII